MDPPSKRVFFQVCSQLCVRGRKVLAKGCFSAFGKGIVAHSAEKGLGN